MAVRLKGDRVLEVELSGESVRTLTGSMVAYDGEVEFKKATFGGEGVRGALKRKVTGESLDLMECKGKGTIWFASEGREIGIIPLTARRCWSSRVRSWPSSDHCKPTSRSLGCGVQLRATGYLLRQ